MTAHRQSGSTRWFAAVVDAAPVDAPEYRCKLVGASGQARALYLAGQIEMALPSSAQWPGRGVVFDGALFNGRDLQDQLGDVSASADNNDAALVLAAYLRWGEDVLRRLKGIFALIIWDSVRDILLCVRDPLGVHPMFYADAGHTLFVAPSIDALIGQPQISAIVNRAALADYLLDRFPKLEETFFAGVSRVPPGHVLRVAPEGRRTYRYWDPAPEGAMNWVGPQELERFDELLDAAVTRYLGFGPAGIFLSGGLDSVTVAAVAAEQSRAHGLPNPWALSLIFPDAEVNEEVIQRSVATQLGLPQVVAPFYDAVGANGLLASALELSRSFRRRSSTPGCRPIAF